MLHKNMNLAKGLVNILHLCHTEDVSTVVTVMSYCNEVVFMSFFPSLCFSLYLRIHYTMLST